MKSALLPLAAAALVLAACDGNPFGAGPPRPSPAPAPAPDPGGIISDRVLPPGTPGPTRDARIVRFEPTRENTGDGFVRDVRYDRATDTFTVDNLGFDGDNRYRRGVPVGSLGPYAVYENAATVNDPVTGTPIAQLPHRALYGVSPSGRTEFAIVRTGAYVGYGFGGFVYQRDGGVVLPAAGQANYAGRYAALRDFAGRVGIEYATGDMNVAIDLDDFNRGGAVQGEVRNRAIFDIDGNDITAAVLDALGTRTGAPQRELPTLRFAVGPGALDANGELAGRLSSATGDADGAAVTFEAGNYYAIVAGPGADEIVGVLVVEAQDPRFTGVTVRETGGFILARQ